MDKDKALQNILNGTASEEEIELLKRLLASREISIGGNVNQSVIIIGSGNTVELPTAALDRLGARPLLGNLERDLTGEEIATGLSLLDSELPLRAPVLLNQFQEQSGRLRSSLKTNPNALNESARKERLEALAHINSLCMETLDIAFNAVALGEALPEYEARCPFRGLESFRVEDREFFFGREELTQKLVGKIQAHSFLAVLGASGSGKSSLVMAGMIPALDLDYTVIRPGTKPLDALDSARGKSLLVVDQFEELFTLTRDEKTRADFISALWDATKSGKVIITLRSDFLGEAGEYRSLSGKIQDHLEIIPPMNAEELRRAMEGQARWARLEFEADLSQQILDDVAGEPGAMPLLQHALWELWNHRHGRHLRANEYRDFGGVRQAITRTAEKVYGECSKPEQEQLGGIFLRLTRLDEDDEGRDTRRRVPLGDLVPASVDTASISALLDKLANARLIVKTLNEDVAEIEVAHEALIRHWERLRIWLNEDRDNLHLRENVSESAKEWEKSGKHESLLNSRWVKLDEALSLAQNPHYRLTDIEQAYLKACVALRNREERERERRLRLTVIASIAAALVFLVLGSFGLIKSNEATAQAGTAQANADKAATAQANAEAEKQNAEKQAEIAQVNELAALAISNKDERPDLALLLSVEAYNRLVNYQTLNSLLISVRAKPQLLGYLVGNQSVNSVSFSPDGKKLATRGFLGEMQLWDVETHSSLLALQFGNPIGYPDNNCVQFSPKGDILATGGATGLVLLDIPADQPAILLLNLPLGPVSSLSFSSNGKFLAIGRRDENTILILDVATRTLLATVHPQGDEKNVSGIPSNTGAQVSFSPDGKTLAGSWSNSITIWDITNLDDVKTLATLDTGNAVVTTIIYSPNGELLATGGYDGSVIFWDSQRFEKIGKTLKSTRGIVYDLAFSPDGRILASDGAGPDPQDKAIILWNVSSQSQLGTLTGHSHAVLSVDFSPDGKMLASGSEDGNVILWNILPDESQEVPGYLPLGTMIKKEQLNTSNDTNFNNGVDEIVYSQDGNYLAIVSGLDVVLWDVNGQRVVRKYAPQGELTNKVAFTPNSKLLALGTQRGRVILYDIAANVELCDIAVIQDEFIYGLVFSPVDGNFLAISSPSTVKIWDVKNCKQINQFSTSNTERKSRPFDSHGNIIFSGDGNALIKENAVWDLRTGKIISELPNCYGSDLSINYAENLIACDAILNQSREDTSQNIVLFDAKTWKPVGQPLKGHQFGITGIEFSTKGQLLAASSSDGTLRLWDLVTHHAVGEPIRASLSGIKSMSLSPDSKILAIGNYDGSIILWDVFPDLWRDWACKVVGRNFTREEWMEYSPNKEYHATCPQWSLEPAQTATPSP